MTIADGDGAVIEMTLPADSSSPARARELVAAHAADLPADLIADAQLIVSELVTNAVVHAGSDVVLRLGRQSSGVYLAVRDRGHAPPRLPEVVPAVSVSGRGLAIVAALATQWGIDRDDAPPGNTVWCVVTAAPSLTPDTCRRIPKTIESGDADVRLGSAE